MRRVTLCKKIEVLIAMIAILASSFFALPVFSATVDNALDQPSSNEVLIASNHQFTIELGAAAVDE